MHIPFIDLVTPNKKLEPIYIERLGQLISTGQYIQGQSVIDFEIRFAEYCGSKHAISVNSGTDALFLSLKALNIGPNDEVITVPNSFIATVSSIIATGATPVFADVGSDYNMNPDLVQEKITKRTKAILPVHLTGRPVQMKKILDLGTSYGIPVIEDAAQAIGAEWENCKTGTIGKVGCFSLHPLKVLGGLGDGGMITTDNDEIASRLKQIKNFGIKSRNTVQTWGTNSRLDTLQALFLDTKMNYLDNWIKKRRNIANAYRHRLRGLVSLPDEETNIKSVYQTFVVQTENREHLIPFLLDRGIETKVHYPVPLHMQPAVKKYITQNFSCPNAEKMADKILSLPIYPEMKVEQVDFIVESIEAFYA